MQTYYTTHEIERDATGHFFDVLAKRHFSSRIGRQVYQGLGWVYFVTSEQFVGLPGMTGARKYTVRRYDPIERTVYTVGDFNVLSRGVAHRLAKRYATEAVSR